MAMTMGQRKESCEILERMVDAFGLEAVLSCLAEVCYEKADHLRSNWQDAAAAKLWERNGNQLDNVKVAT